MTFCDTLPKTKRPRAERPCEPTTMRSGCQVSAFLMIAQAGESAHASAHTSQVGKDF